MMLRSRLSLFARLVLAAALFAQAALAFAGCALPQFDATRAVRAAEPAAGPMDGPCAGMADNGALCLAHCLQADQNVDGADRLPPMAPPRAWRFADPAQDADPVALHHTGELALRGSPPLNLLHCSLQN